MPNRLLQSTRSHYLSKAPMHIKAAQPPDDNRNSAPPAAADRVADRKAAQPPNDNRNSAPPATRSAAAGYAICRRRRRDLPLRRLRDLPPPATRSTAPLASCSLRPLRSSRITNRASCPPPRSREVNGRSARILLAPPSHIVADHESGILPSSAIA